MAKFTLTTTEINWLVMALNHDIAFMQDEINQNPDDQILFAVGRATIDARKALRTKLTDIQASDAKMISVIK